MRKMHCLHHAAWLAALGIMLSPWALAAPVSDTQTYTLGTCPVTGQKLGGMGEPIVKEINGRQVRFCCSACPAAYEKDPAKYEKKVDAATIEQEKADYPLDTCVVTGNKLGSAGTPVDYVYGNRLVRFCTADCVAQFQKDPAKYIAKLDEAVIAKQKPTYTVKTCPVTGEQLGDHPVEMVIANRLVELCCTDCVKQVKANPQKYLAKLDEMMAKQGGSPEKASTAQS